MNPPKGIWHCLEIFWAVLEGTTQWPGIFQTSFNAEDIPLQQRIIQHKISIVSRLKNPGTHWHQKYEIQHIGTCYVVEVTKKSKSQALPWRREYLSSLIFNIKAGMNSSDNNSKYAINHYVYDCWINGTNDKCSGQLGDFSRLESKNQPRKDYSYLVNKAKPEGSWEEIS